MRFSELAYLLRYPTLDIQLLALDLTLGDSFQPNYEHHEMRMKHAETRFSVAF